MFEANFNQNPAALCRICLKTDISAIVLDQDALSMLVICFKGDINSGIDPFRICAMCSVKVQEYYNFRISVIQAQQTYNEMKERYILQSELQESEYKTLEIDTMIDISKTNECPKCGKVFKQAKNLKEHIKRHYDTKKYACEICGKRFFKLFNVTEHLRIHTGQRPFACGFCDKTFTRNVLLQNHIKRFHQKEGNLICDICNKRFIDNYQLKLHLRTHDDKKLFNCDDCDKSFKTKAQLQSHVKYKHTLEKNFVCNFCGKAFTANGTLNEHLRTHTGEKREPKHICKTCGKKCLTTQLKIHIRCAHTGERPFSCAICSNNFPTKSALNIHLNIHSCAKPFACYCGKSFSAKCSLKVHERSHFEERNIS